MFRREARWRMVAVPVLMAVGLLMALIGPPMLKWLAPASPRIRWNEDAGTHME